MATGARPQAANTWRRKVERARYTDELLDGRMALIDERFERGFEEMAAMRAEMRAGFADMRAEISGVRGDLSGVRADISAVRADLSATQRQMIQIVAGLAIALLGVLTAAIAAGA